MGTPKKTITDPHIPCTLPPELEERLRSRFEEYHVDLSTIIRDYIEASKLEYTRDFSSILDKQTQLIETLIARVESIEQMRLHEQKIVPISSSTSAKKEQNEEPDSSTMHDKNLKSAPEQNTFHVPDDELHALGLRFAAYRAVHKDISKRNMMDTMSDITMEFSDYLENPISVKECITWSKKKFSRPTRREKYDRLCKCLNHFEPILEDKKQQ